LRDPASHPSLDQIANSLRFGNNNWIVPGGPCEDFDGSIGFVCSIGKCIEAALLCRRANVPRISLESRLSRGYATGLDALRASAVGCQNANGQREGHSDGGQPAPA
jgi:hypothetical protein